MLQVWSPQRLHPNNLLVERGEVKRLERFTVNDLIGR
jgi:hypothetical protein